MARYDSQSADKAAKCGGEQTGKADLVAQHATKALTNLGKQPFNPLEC